MRHYKKDNIKPSLLMRLTDNNPRIRGEVKAVSIMSMSDYRKAILEDVMFLLNSNTLFGSQSIYSSEKTYHDLYNHVIPDNVLASTLNYGTPALSGLIVSNVNWFEVEQEIKLAIMRFEDRLETDSIRVSIHLDDIALLNRSELLIEIFGNLKVTHNSKEFWLKTKVDIETGLFSLVKGNANE